MTSRWPRSLLVVLSCLLWLGPAHAEALSASSSSARQADVGVPLLRNFSPMDYGAGPQNWAVVQDKRGLIYVGNSDDGVLEFDGDHWRRIAVPNLSTVRSLALAADGRVYVGCVGELGYLAPDDHGRMRYVSLLDRIEPRYRRFADVWRTFAARDGIYFATSSKIFRFNGNHVDVWKAQTSFHLTFLVRNRLYVRETGRGLMELSAGKLKMLNGGERFARERIYAMLPWGKTTADGGGSLLIGTRTQGWFIYDGHQFRPWKTDADATIKRNQIYDAQWLANGKLAVATLQGGVILLDRQGHETGRLRRADGLINDTIFAMYQDRENGLWLALDNGLARVDMASALSYFSPNSGLDGSVLSIGRYRSSLYVGTTKGLFRLQHGDDGNAYFSRVPGIRDQVWALLDMDHSLLVGTSMGMFEIDGGSARLRLADKTAYSLLRSIRDPSRVFLGLSDGVETMRLAHGHWLDEGRIPGISGEVRSLAEDAVGRIWMSLSNDGAARLTLPDDWKTAGGAAARVEHFDTPHATAMKTGDALVYNIAGTIRFATARGIYRFDGRSQRIVADPGFAHLFPPGTRQASLLSEDNRGRVWMYTSDDSDTLRQTGVAIPDPDGSYHWDPRPLRAFSGMGVSAIHADKDGVMWFGANDGLYRYDPYASVHYSKPLPVLLDKVTDHAGHLLWGGAGQATPATLRWTDNSLRIEYSSPNFDSSMANRFQVMLEGMDTQWSPWSKETYRDYTNLHEGHYRFRVRSRDAYGNLSKEATYDFRVLPPWYRTWWAYLAVLMLLGVIIWLGFQMRSITLRRRNLVLARLVAARTRELSASHRALQRANAALVDLNITDALTGLRNRRYVLDHIEQDVATVQRNYGELARSGAEGGHRNIDLLFLMIDIDHFKEINDRHGHTAGDCVLTQMRDILQAATREMDTPVRWGGEEFLVIARFASSEFGAVIAERVRSMVAQYAFDLGNGQTIQRTCSIGFALYPLLADAPQRFNWEDVINIADQCLYAAKRNGRNCWVGVQSRHKAVSEDVAAGLPVNLDVLVAEGYLQLLVSPAPE